MNKKTFTKTHCPYKWIMSKTEPDLLDDKWLADLDQLIKSVREEVINECIKSAESVRFFNGYGGYGGSVKFKEAEKYRKQGYNSAKREILITLRDKE